MQDMREVVMLEKLSGQLAVIGHVGLGHVHSHSGFVQDDSAGFAVVGDLLRGILGVDTRVRTVRTERNGWVEVETFGGGIGRAYARRGFTVYESELAQRAVRADGLYTQRCAFQAFGRVYGQGVSEAAVAFQGALALAVMDSFERAAPGHVRAADAASDGRIDRMAAHTAEIAGVPLSLMLVINGSAGGIGPDEDNEGNTAGGAKGELMRTFYIDTVDTIVVESKAYIPALADRITNPTYYVRAQEGLDNTKLGRLLLSAAEGEGLPCLYANDAMPQVPGGLARQTADFADGLLVLASRLKSAESAREKTEIVAELARRISEDAGGVTFMSNGLHEIVRGAGLIPDGRAALLSMLVPAADPAAVPMLDERDVEGYRRIVERTVSIWR